MNIQTNIEKIARNFNIDPVEAALMDVARAIQTTQTMHNQDESRYRGLARHVDRRGSPLEDCVLEIYPSGSLAIHTAIRSRIQSDQRDVDAVLEVAFHPNTDPKWALDQLYKAIRGGKGSQYHDYRIETNSRCVTIWYPDGVTVDLMPVVRLNNTPERVANLFNYKAETGESYHKEVNPKGFANTFNTQMEINTTFQSRFDARRYLVDGETYVEFAKRQTSSGVPAMMDKAETQPMPVHVPLDQKSPRVVALQLIKRFRDKRYRKHDDHRARRKPPSVVMAAIALDVGPTHDNLVNEVIAIADHMRRRIQHAERNLQLLEVRNPSHYPDIFTDRWPEARSDQQLWISDLRTLTESLELLKRTGFDPAVIQTTFDDLFGEKAGEVALRDYHRAQTVQLEKGVLGMTPAGKLQTTKLPAGIATPAISSAAAASTLIVPARANTNMGGAVADDNCW